MSEEDPRDENSGQFAASGFRDPLTLYHAVRAIATVAAEQAKCDPLEISRDKFNAVRAVWPEPQPPAAKEIQRRLARPGEDYLPRQNS